MPSKGYPTLPQRQKKARNNGQEVPDAHPGPDVSRRYVDAAKVLELTGDWPTSLAIRFFGPQLMGSMAFAIDPTAKFQNSYRVISDEKRRVVHETQVTDFTTHVVSRVRTYRNYIVDDPNVHPEFLVSDVTENVDEDLFGENHLKSESFLSDSVQSQRYKGQDFGTMEMLKDIENERQGRVAYTYQNTYIGYIEATAPYILYEKEVTTYSVVYDGPIAFPVGNWCFVDDVAALLATSKRIAEDKLFSVLPNALPNKRQFNLLYQIVELKDLPQLIHGVKDFANFVATIAKDTQLKFLKLDKALSDAYLTYLFGAKSLTDAVNSLLKTPERLAKRFNYLLAKNNKVSTGHFAIQIDDANWTYVSPNYTNFEPQGSRVKENSTTVDTHIDVKCVVNQTLHFPEIKAPKFLDKNYREFIGLQPRLVDFYNIVPFTWLVDWFVGLGEYINMMDTLNDDRFLINFGFMTVIIQSEYKSSGVLIVNDLITTFRNGEDDEVLESNTREIPYFTKHRFRHHKRWSVADLDGSKTADNKNGNLSDSQLSILGALISKFTKH